MEKEEIHQHIASDQLIEGAVKGRDASIHLFIYLMLLTVGNLLKDDPFARRNPRQ
jgi:hypothetical protein